MKGGFALSMGLTSPLTAWYGYYASSRRERVPGAERRGVNEMDFILNNAAAIIAVAIVLGLAVGIFRALSGR